MLTLSKRLSVASLTFALISVFPTALGQEENNSAQIYDIEDFEQFKPRTAAEMANLIPGFRLEDARTRRGLGQGGANVLINGQRISGKLGAADQLSKISIGQVARIEILDGAALNVTGLTGAVINVVTKAGGVTGSWAWAPEFRNRREPSWYDGNFTISKTFENVSATLKLENESLRTGSVGPKDFFAPNGTFYETRYEDSQSYSDTPSASLNLSWKGETGNNANYDMRIYQSIENDHHIAQRRAITQDGMNGLLYYVSEAEDWGFAINSDYERNLGPGSIKIFGVYDRKHEPFIEQYDDFPEQTPVSGRRTSEVSDSLEAIIRAEYRWSNKPNTDWQISLESAYNELDQETQLFKRNNFGEYLPQELSDPNSLIQEQRYETALTHNRKINDKLDVQTSIGIEFSDTSLESLNTENRSFVRPNGFLNASYALSPTFQLRGGLERRVGQLDFSQFTSSIDLVNDLDRSSNSELVPSQYWISSFEMEKKFSDDSTLKTRFFYENIDDIIDRIPVGIDGNAIGNLDSATQYGMDLVATIRGDRWGIANAKLDINLQFKETEVEDPITQELREISANLRRSYSVEFRQDIPNSDIAYGIVWSKENNSLSYFPTTIGERNFVGAQVSTMIEHKDIMGARVRLSAKNLTNQGERRYREFYTTRRDIGTLRRSHNSVRHYQPYFELTVSNTF